MSTEQSEGETQTAHSQVDIAQQATNPAPAPTPREKNPKRVAAGKLVAERTRIAREQQKKIHSSGFCRNCKQQCETTPPTT